MGWVFSYKFAVLSNRKLLGFKVTSVWAMLFTIDNGMFLNFYLNWIFTLTLFQTYMTSVEHKGNMSCCFVFLFFVQAVGSSVVLDPNDIHYVDKTVISNIKISYFFVLVSVYFPYFTEPICSSTNPLPPSVIFFITADVERPVSVWTDQRWEL